MFTKFQHFGITIKEDIKENVSITDRQEYWIGILEPLKNCDVKEAIPTTI